jgi:hypothetical protein
VKITAEKSKTGYKGWVLTIDGKTESIRFWAEHYGIPDNIIRNRLNCKEHTVEKIFALPRTSHQVEVEYEGDITQVDVRNLAKRSGVPAQMIRDRLRAGWPIEEALDLDAGKRRLDKARRSTTSKFITFRGKTQGLNNWARELGFRPDTLKKRLYFYDWDVEEAFTVPVDRSRDEWVIHTVGSK